MERGEAGVTGEAVVAEMMRRMMERVVRNGVRRELRRKGRWKGVIVGRAAVKFSSN